MEFKWEQLTDGPVETFKAQLATSSLYRVDHYVEVINEHGRQCWELRTSTLCYAADR